jgi:hypothetical protein
MAGSKYAHLKGKFKRLTPGEATQSDDKEPDELEADLKFLDMVLLRKQELIAEYGALTSTFVAQKFRDARIKKDEYDRGGAELNVEVEALKELMKETLEFEGASGVKLADGYQVTSRDTVVGVVTDKQAFHKWCVENDLLPLMRLPSPTVSKLIKERAENNQAFPDGAEGRSRVTISLIKPRG